MSKVTLKNLSKSFGEIVAVQNLNLEIQQGEFFSLLGPSGCGKTTTLRMIAGFEFPTSGQIFFDDKEVTYLKPNRRNSGMVFQNYALFPHMSVFENVAFGLQARKVQKSKIRDRVNKALDLVDLTNFEFRKVTELSGGQQQRVALARAIVIEPDILLLDEPLSNLDAKLREETREEIKALQRRLGLTTIYVTHDQEEALTLSDRIAVLNQGKCHQVGMPKEIYQKPKNRFIANFVGNSNILKGRYFINSDGSAQIEITSRWKVQLEAKRAWNFQEGQTLWISLRPENIYFVNGDKTAATVFKGKIQTMKFSGSTVDYEIEVDGLILRVKKLVAEDDFKRKQSEKVLLQILPCHINILTY
ncbi:MAG: ABC transporter ATP-binding protein [bacterium]